MNLGAFGHNVSTDSDKSDVMSVVEVARQMLIILLQSEQCINSLFTHTSRHKSMLGRKEVATSGLRILESKITALRVITTITSLFEPLPQHDMTTPKIFRANSNNFISYVCSDKLHNYM